MKNQNMLLKKDIKTDFYCHLCDIYDFGSSKSYIISCRGLPLKQDFEWNYDNFLTGYMKLRKCRYNRFYKNVQTSH